MAKKAKAGPSQSKIKDLTPNSKTAGKVKGGRITNVRANASALAGGSAAGASPIQASISTK